MPYAGTGSWGLPEFQITEKFGGNKKSVEEAKATTDMINKSMAVVEKAKNITIPKSKPVVYGPPAPKGNILGDKTQAPAPTPKTKDKSSGSSGGGSGKSEAQKEMERQQSEVNSIYDDIMNYIGKQRDNLNKSKGDILKLASNPYESLKPRVQASADEAVTNLQGLTTQAQAQGENALDSARRLYGELGSRNQQVFGSGALSSAGQASSELLARDQARQFGDIRTQVSAQIGDIEKQIVNVQRERDVKLNEIESQKQQAITQAELNFRDKLAQIDQMEYQTKQSKKIDKINLLREYRQEVADINKYTRELQSGVASDSALKDSELQALYNKLVNDFGGTVGTAQAGVDNISSNLDASGQEIAYNNAMGYGSDPLATATGAYGKKKSYDDIYGYGP
jgi:hypothetical protein